MRERPECSTCRVFNRSYFSILEPEDLENLKFEKSSSFYKTGQQVFHEDSRAVGVYCLHSGKVKLFKAGSDGKEQIVRFVTPGELFGYSSVTGSRHYMLTAEAIEDSVICFINGVTFAELTEKYPELLKALLSTLGNMLNETEERMISIAQKPVRERLAEALLTLCHKFHPEGCKDNNVLNLSREDLANIVGSATETIIRLLSEFREEKIINIEGRRIILKDVRKLKRLANFKIR
ncbi:MAG TPA: Crp/Fnr family transcriptional regulator [Bacteroidales bacterium]|nr:Crp/Fnr family transcriptional regulator [Bacteroidales bacterium]